MDVARLSLYRKSPLPHLGSVIVKFTIFGQTNTAVFSTPTFADTSDSRFAWPSDPFQPSNPSPTQLRTDRPRLIAPAYKWEALPTLIANDPYLQEWNNTIFGNASDWNSMVPVPYYMDGDSGILDVCRQEKERIKAFAYVYRMTNDSSWVDRAWEEILVSFVLKSFTCL